MNYRLLLARVTVQSKQSGSRAARAVLKMFWFSRGAGELTSRQNWEQNTAGFCP